MDSEVSNNKVHIENSKISWNYITDPPNKPWIKKEIITEVENILYEVITVHQNLWDKAKTLYKRIFIVLKCSVRNIKFKINDLHLHLRKLEK